MTTRAPVNAPTADRGVAVGIFAVSAALLMTELALTRIFSVTMFYHFAFLAISIALFGLSASSVAVAAVSPASSPAAATTVSGGRSHS